MSRPGSQVHLYAQVWNEAALLPAFFRHYDPVVTHYTIFDDGSDDGTLEILAAHPRVAVLSFPRSDPESFVASERVLSNRCWKDSRGQADWVIVTDVDEFLVHPDLPGYLTRAHAAGVTAVPALGFQLISETTWPADRSPVDVETGAAWAQMLKISVFDPDAITDIGYGPGRHEADPVGAVVLPERDEMALLHAKFLGRIESLARQHGLGRRLGDRDRAEGWGVEYQFARSRFDVEFDRMLAGAGELGAWRAGHDYPLTPWWSARDYPRVAVPTTSITRSTSDGVRPG
ncbi:MAG: glycosyltransferase family 2 protein [Candidatus Nanopelagicales bacterium]